MVERFNQTLQRMLAKVVHLRKSNWRAFLDTCVFAYNTSCHDSTHFTPYELMFSRKAVLPIDLEIMKATPEEEVERFENMEEADTSAVAKQREERLDKAMVNILKAQKKQKEQYDKKHAQPHHFAEGQLVLKKGFRRKKHKGGKLDAWFVGPFTIKKRLTRGIYELVSEDGKTTLRATGGHLKPYHRPSPTSSPNNKSTEVNEKDYYLCLI